MTFDAHSKTWRICAALSLLFLVSLGVRQASAQYSSRWLSVGDLQHLYSGGGAQPEEYNNWQMNWRAIHPQQSWMHATGVWIAAKNWKAPDGTTFKNRIEHIGPRAKGTDEFFEVQHELIGKFEIPTVTVDGFPTFANHVQLDEVDPSIGSDQMILNTANTALGLTMQRRIMAWSNEYNDDFHIIEYTFTNTGNVDTDPDVELPDQTLNGVIIALMQRVKIAAPAGAWDNTVANMAWGGGTMTDVLGDGINDYGLDWRGQFNWSGLMTGNTNFNTIGSPVWFPGSWWYTGVPFDTIGRLAGAGMMGNLVLHADEAPHGAGQSAGDDPAQPFLMTWLNSDDGDLTGNNNDANEAGMTLERNFLERGSSTRPNMPEKWADSGSGARTVPSWAYYVEPAADGEIQTSQDFVEHFATQTHNYQLGNIGNSATYYNGFGPFDFAPGQQVKIVMFEGVAGLTDTMSIELGRWYKRQVLSNGQGNADAARYSWNPRQNTTCAEGSSPDCLSLTKNEWVMTTRDSLFQAFRRARKIYQNGYTGVAEPPPPPTSLTVTSGAAKGGTNGVIKLAWTAESDPAGGWDIFRAENRYDGIPVPDKKTAYVKIAHAPGSAREYEDSAVAGRKFFYYMQAVGPDIPSDPLGVAGPPGPAGTTGRLRSSRYFAQTYAGAVLVTEPGTLSELVIAPNPYSRAQALGGLSQTETKIQFFKIPGDVTIKIYTELGELVKTIEHTNGSGTDEWNLTTDSNQRIASGLYIAVFRDNATNEQTIRKFVVLM